MIASFTVAHLVLSGYYPLPFFNRSHKIPTKHIKIKSDKVIKCGKV